MHTMSKKISYSIVLVLFVLTGAKLAWAQAVTKDSVSTQDNAKSEEANHDLSFEQVMNLREQGVVALVMAPHPYFLFGCCIGDELAIHHDLFDLVELSSFHTKSPLPKSWASLDYFNRNRKAEAVAKRFGIPLFASSDAHNIGKFGVSYTLVEAEPNLESVVRTLQSRDQTKITPVNKPLSFFGYMAEIPKLLAYQ